MAKASIPVDLFNPGQVFACLGFAEAADVLLGNAVGGFAWPRGGEPRFAIQANASEHPFGAVLEFLSKAHLRRLAPTGYVDPLAAGKKKSKKNVKKPRKEEQMDEESGVSPLHLIEAFPANEADRLALPLRLEHDGRHIDITHWCDGSSRNSFKLFAGQQRSDVIAQQMLEAIQTLCSKHNGKILDDPFGLTVPLGGSSFKFDSRKSWTGIDAGYSPDEQSHDVRASPIVEMLAAVGLEHARPDEFETRQVRYGIWGIPLPLLLARPALSGAFIGVPMRVFRFTLDLAGKNKIVTFAQEEAT
ncbi:MAG TPA: type I-U CRISPR-associated protein Cas8c [Terriglobales bacterium]|nr:type I-U CRISPR-associated protein Cas8c [Terriglobales bacterium]